MVLTLTARTACKTFSFSDGSACQTVCVICRDRQIVMITGKQMLIYGPPQTCRRHNGTVWCSSLGSEVVTSEWALPTCLNGWQHSVAAVKGNMDVNISNRDRVKKVTVMAVMKWNIWGTPWSHRGHWVESAWRPVQRRWCKVERPHGRDVR